MAIKKKYRKKTYKRKSKRGVYKSKYYRRKKTSFRKKVMKIVNSNAELKYVEGY
jgi:hypothetical protein